MSGTAAQRDRVWTDIHLLNLIVDETLTAEARENHH